ncbi:hypothetical protein [Nitrosopumilus sp. b1]|nr:hypothetical protein [Nitrosopumilus sp. b1]
MARTFYWDQNDPSDDDRIDQGKRKMRMTFSAGPYSWNTDAWFDVR